MSFVCLFERKKRVQLVLMLLVSGWRRRNQNRARRLLRCELFVCPATAQHHLDFSLRTGEAVAKQL